MIIEFSVGNFRSFKDIQTLSMLASSSHGTEGGTADSRIITTPFGMNLLKSKAVYGANASGKSNLVKALFTFLRIVRDSVKDEKTLEKAIQPFVLSTETEHEPSFFQMVFIQGDTQYRYGFEATEKRIIAEWLFMKSLSKQRTREIPLFVRENQEISAHEKHFRGWQIVSGSDLFKENIPFLYASALIIGKEGIAKQVFDYLMLIIIADGDKTVPLHASAVQFLDDEVLAREMLQMLQAADIGIEGISYAEFHKDIVPLHLQESAFQDGEMMRLALTKHNIYDANNKAVSNKLFLLVSEESNGTKKIFEFSPILLEALKASRPIIIDEIDTALHSRLTKKIIEFFNSSLNQRAQLIFATHDINLLSDNLLRRDQISFVEKDRYGASTVYSLADFKGVRKGTSVDKEYMRGKYGAVPFVGDFAAILDMEA